MDNDYYLFKTDILAGLITYSTDKRMAANLETISVERAHAVINMNKQGEKPLSLQEDGKNTEPERPADLLAGGDITRFDKNKKGKKNKKRSGNGTNNNAKPRGNEGGKPNNNEGGRPNNNEGRKPKNHEGGKPRNNGGKPQGNGKPHKKPENHNPES
jgi:hypothetical protein